jgi:acetyl/propionyl-CoA carboxylase alpha subunit
VFETVLVADRGVAGLRVVRACQRLGALAVAVHGDEDARAPHVRQADEAVLLGGSAAEDTYADGRKVLEAARRSAAQAVHPGAGALATDAAFARAVQDAALTWLGPEPALLERPVVEPPAGADRRVTVVLLSQGGGVVQCLGRRTRLGQLLDEEPAPGLGAPEAQQVLDAAAAWAADGDGVGVLAVDVALGPDGATALGPVPVSAPGGAATAAVGGLDLVEAQLRLAAGDSPPRAGERRAATALSLQVRAAEHFAGRLRRFRMPTGDGVRTECAVAEGERLSAHRSRLLAVVTVEGSDRTEVLQRAAASLSAFEVAGVPTNLGLLRETLADPSVAAGRPDFALLERTRTA